MRPAGALDEGRLAFEFKQLRMIPAQLGGVGLDVEPCCQFVLEIKPAPDLDLEAPVTFDVHLDVAGFPGQPPRCHCNAPLDHLPPRVQRSQVVDPMGSVRLPLLDARSGWSRSYSSAVVFYALRRLFHRGDPRLGCRGPPPPRDARRLRGDRRPEPVAGRDDAPGLSAGPLDVVAGHGCDQGKRAAMEDVAHVRTRIRVPERDTANAALLIVFDGHGGKRCAEWASELLPERVLWNLKDPARSWRDALWDAFLDADAELRKRADRERDASGSTVLACLFDGTDRLYVASLGDCRCVLATRDGYCNLTTDCRADRPDEVARVVAARGFVANRRLNGQIAVSRALGDFAFKSPPDAPPAVSCEPDITEVQLRDGDDFLLIGCDGLYDVLTSEEAVDFARDQLRAGRPLDAAALNLVHHAIDDRDSRDNVSVILAKLSPAADLRGGAAAAPRAFDANDADALLADLDLAASSHGDDVDDRVFARYAPQAQSRRHRAVNEADAAAGGPSALHGSSRVNASPYAPPAPQGEGRANSKSKIMDDDDLMDFLLDDANFD